MQRIEPYHANDRRCYYGVPCSDLSREWHTKDRARKQLREHDARVTYYPNGSFYVGFIGTEIATDDCHTFWACYDALYSKLTEVETR